MVAFDKLQTLKSNNTLTWETPQRVYLTLNNVPALWVATKDEPIPYANQAGYTNGTVSTIGTAISYGALTRLFTVTEQGLYMIKVEQTVNVSDFVALVPSNGHIQILDSLNNVVGGTETAIHKSTAGMVALGMLCYNISLCVCVSLSPDDYRVYVKDDSGGGTGGLLLGKGSTTFFKLK